MRDRRLGVIFDVDGTLVDSNDAHAWAWVDTFAEAGRAVAFDTVRPLIGMGGDKLVPRLTGLDPDDPRVEELSSRRAEIFRARWLPTVRPLPGAVALIARLRTERVPIAVATSAREEEVGPLLDLVAARDLLATATAADDAERSKPDPDIVDAAIRRLGLPRDVIVMIGDTPYDLEAARRAGIAMIAVRSGGWDDAALRGAVGVFDGPAELLAYVTRTRKEPARRPTRWTSRRDPQRRARRRAGPRLGGRR